MPNPHVVVGVTPDELESLELMRPPAVHPALPDGQNVEFVTILGPRSVRMRVHERGVGETRSCGTGICAAVVAAATAAGDGADGSTWRVDVPGGSCRVIWHRDGSIELFGPAVIVAEIELDESWLAERVR
jgi:diaminopimelate epimerase